eukprot:gene2068-2345_t
MADDGNREKEQESIWHTLRSRHQIQAPRRDLVKTQISRCAASIVSNPDVPGADADTAPCALTLLGLLQYAGKVFADKLEAAEVASAGKQLDCIGGKRMAGNRCAATAATVITHSTVYIFADDTKIYKETKTAQDVQLLQQDLDSLIKWSVTWLLKFHPAKCKVLPAGINANKNSCYINGQKLCAPRVNSFESRLDKHGMNEDILYNYKAAPPGVVKKLESNIEA